jgi:site-specific recombinase XerD
MEIKECLHSFKTWLKNKSYSDSTIRNYLADLNRYFKFTDNSNLFLPQAVNQYLDSIKADYNKNRYLSSLSKFFHFAIDQQIIKTNPLKKKYTKTNQSSPENVLSLYQSFLTKKKFSATTIKNYLNDIQQFINWNQTNPEPK